MKIVSRYFVLKLKSCIKAFGKSAAGMFWVLALLVAGVLAISFGFQNEQVLQRVKVGMVIPESETMIQTGVQFLSAMDSIESICEFEYMDEEEARDGLQNGDLQVVIILPVNFYQDVYQGTNTPAEILMTEENDIHHQVFRELLVAAVSYLQTSESGVYAMLDASRQESTIIGRTKIGDLMAEKYILELFDRMDIYEEKTVSSLGIVDFTEYLVIMLLTMVLLLVGTNFSVLYQPNERVVESKLKAEGMHPVLLSLTKVAVITLCLWGLWGISYMGISWVSAAWDLDILWWDASHLIYGLGLCLSIAAFYHIVYQISGNGTQGSIVLIFINIGMLLCSGILMPSSYFSEAVAFLGRCMPLALWNDYTQRFMFDSVTPVGMAIFILVTCIEIVVGAVVVWKEG